jgi:hypothetical protein
MQGLYLLAKIPILKISYQFEQIIINDIYLTHAALVSNFGYEME